MTNKPTGPMHEKFINFGTWIASLIALYGQDMEGVEDLKTQVSEYYQTEDNYLATYFSVIPGVMSQEKTRGIIMEVRGLKDDELRKQAIENAVKKIKMAKIAIDAFLQVPDDELDKAVKKFSLYVNLFTDMYVNK
jgi:hypothetical protein